MVSQASLSFNLKKSVSQSRIAKPYRKAVSQSRFASFRFAKDHKPLFDTFLKLNRFFLSFIHIIYIVYTPYLADIKKLSFKLVLFFFSCFLLILVPRPYSSFSYIENGKP
jgi:hypothetical protein